MEGENEWIYFYIHLGKGRKEYYRFRFCNDNTENVCQRGFCSQKAFVQCSLREYSTQHVFYCTQCWFDFNTVTATYPTYRKCSWYFE